LASSALDMSLASRMVRTLLDFNCTSIPFLMNITAKILQKFSEVSQN